MRGGGCKDGAVTVPHEMHALVWNYVATIEGVRSLPRLALEVENAGDAGDGSKTYGVLQRCMRESI